MKKEGFYLLQSPLREHFECLLYTISFLADCQAWLTFGKTERIKSGKFFAVPISKYKVIKKENGYYLKARVRMEDGKLLTKEFGPVPNKIAENFFISLNNYEEQKAKKEKLSAFLTKILEDQNERLSQLFASYKEVNRKKFEAVKSQTFDKAAEFRDEDKNFMEKISEISKEKIATNSGLKWATDDHVWDILKEL